MGAWALPLPTIDPQIVLRSARALERYGPDFTYGHFAAVKHLPVAVAGVAGVASLFTLAQIPPARKFLLGQDGVRRRARRPRSGRRAGSR